MSAGGGGDGGGEAKFDLPTFDDIRNEITSRISAIAKNPLQGAINANLDVLKTMSGYQAADETLGSVFGRNLARDQQRKAEADLQHEEGVRDQQLLNERSQKQIADQAASSAANRGGVYSKGAAVAPVKTGPTIGINSPEKDFLGLS